MTKTTVALIITIKINDARLYVSNVWCLTNIHSGFTVFQKRGYSINSALLILSKPFYYGCIK